MNRKSSGTGRTTFARQEQFEAHLKVLELAHAGRRLSFGELDDVHLWDVAQFETVKETLEGLGALSPTGGLTALGRQMEPFVAYEHNIGPRCARALLAAKDTCPFTVATICSVLAAETPFFVYYKQLANNLLGQWVNHKQFRTPGSRSDLTTLYNAFTKMREVENDPLQDVRDYALENALSLRGFQQARQIQEFLFRTLQRLGWSRESTMPAEEVVTECFLHGFWDRTICGSTGGFAEPSRGGEYVKLPEDSLQTNFDEVMSDLVIGVGLIYLQGTAYGKSSFVALAPITPEQVAKLMPGKVTMERFNYRFSRSNNRVECYEDWQWTDSSKAFCRRFGQPAPSCPQSAQVLASALRSGELQTPSSPEFTRYKEAVLRAADGELPVVTEQQILSHWTGQLSACTRADEIHPTLLRLGWSELAELIGLPDVEARVTAVEEKYPNSLSIAGKTLPVTYSTATGRKSIAVTLGGSAEANELLSVMTPESFPADWAGHVVLVVVESDGYGSRLPWPADDLHQLRRLVACRLAAKELPTTNEPLATAARRIVKTLSVIHPGQPAPETVYVVAGAGQCLHSITDVTHYRDKFLHSSLSTTATVAGKAICPAKGDPDNVEVEATVSAAMALLEYEQDDLNPSGESVGLAIAQAEEVIRESVMTRKNARDELRQEARTLELHARIQARPDVSSAAVALTKELGTAKSYIPKRHVLDDARAEIGRLRAELPALDETARARIEVELEITDLLARAEKGYGEPKHQAKQAIDRMKRKLRQDGDLAGAQAMLPELEKAVHIAETSTPDSGLRGGTSTPRSNQGKRKKS